MRYLAVAWVALTIIVGVCTFAALFWALGGGFGNGSESAPTVVVQVEEISTQTPQPAPTAAAEEPLPEGEGIGGGGEGVVEDGPPPPGSESGMGYGVQLQAVNLGDPGYWMDLAANGLGFNWIKHQFQWGVYGSAGPDQFDWSGYDPMMAAAAERGLNVMLSVVGAPEWSRAIEIGRAHV